MSKINIAPARSFGEIARGILERLRPRSFGSIILYDDVEDTMSLYPSGRYLVLDKQSLYLFTFEVFEDNSFKMINYIVNLTRRNISHNQIRAEFALKETIKRRVMIHNSGRKYMSLVPIQAVCAIVGPSVLRRTAKRPSELGQHKCIPMVAGLFQGPDAATMLHQVSATLRAFQGTIDVLGNSNFLLIITIPHQVDIQTIEDLSFWMTDEGAEVFINI